MAPMQTIANTAEFASAKEQMEGHIQAQGILISECLGAELHCEYVSLGELIKCVDWS